MNSVVKKIGQRVTNLQELAITEKKLYEPIKLRKNWSAPVIYKVQNV